MKIRYVLTAVVFVFVAGCIDSGRATPLQQSMQQIMSSGWQDYSKFRCDSTTKTFTASAIMLLHQQGLLHIDDYLTDPIPGTSNPYVPEIPESGCSALLM